VNWKGKTVAKVSAGSNRGVISLLAGAETEGADVTEKVLMQALVDGGKLVLTGNGSVEIDSSLCNGKVVSIREMTVCIGTDSNWRVLALCTAPYRPGT
jgi:hypothetical protein